MKHCPGVCNMNLLASVANLGPLGYRLHWTTAERQHSRNADIEAMPAAEAATKVVAGTAADAASQAEQMSAADAVTQAVAGAAASKEPFTPAQSPKRSVSRLAAGLAKLVNPSGRAAAVIRTSSSGQGDVQHEKKILQVRLLLSVCVGCPRPVK